MTNPTWQDEASTLPRPTQEEIDEYADGVVYHTTSDGTLLYFDREHGEWRMREKSTP